MARRVLVCAALALASGCGSSNASAPPDGGTDAAPAPGGPDATLAGDAGEAGPPPITAPPDTWTWIDFPDSRCASGNPTGIAVNPHPGATELLVYFEGGGSCYDAETCWGASPSAANLVAYDATTFQSAKQRAYPPLVRTFAGNPFAAMNMVYVPYCTGDLHFGTLSTAFTVNGATQPTYFWGATDLDLFLARLVTTFPGPSRVYSFGTSAGGFASFLAFDKIARAFGVRVDVIDDSGPPLTRPSQMGNEGLFKAWGAVLPSGCSACTGFLDVMKYDRQAQPASKLAFLSLAEDTTISADFGYALSDYGPAIETLFSSNFGSDPNVATYIVGGDPGHVVESQPALAPDYLPWLTELVNDGGWASGGLDAGAD
jgi:hypothetical protein